MNSLPEIYTELNFEVTTQPTHTYKLDFENKRIVGSCDDLTAMVQAVRKLISTERYSERIFSGDYGVSLARLVGASLSYVRAVIRTTLEDAFKSDSRIAGLKSCTVNQIDTDQLEINAVVKTVYGEVYVTQELRG